MIQCSSINWIDIGSGEKDLVADKQLNVNQECTLVKVSCKGW